MQPLRLANAYFIGHLLDQVADLNLSRQSNDSLLIWIKDERYDTFRWLDESQRGLTAHKQQLEMGVESEAFSRCEWMSGPMSHRASTRSLSLNANSEGCCSKCARRRTEEQERNDSTYNQFRGSLVRISKSLLHHQFLALVVLMLDGVILALLLAVLCTRRRFDIRSFDLSLVGTLERTLGRVLGFEGLFSLLQGARLMRVTRTHSG